MTEEKDNNVLTTPHTLDIVFRYMVNNGEFISSNVIMDECNITRTQFYNALDQLRKLKLIEVKVDMKDFRKKYYRAKKRVEDEY